MAGEPKEPNIELPGGPPLTGLMMGLPLSMSVGGLSPLQNPTGQPLVVLRMETAIGTLVFGLDPDMALGLGEHLAKHAALLKTGLQIVTNGQVPHA